MKWNDFCPNKCPPCPVHALQEMVDATIPLLVIAVSIFIALMVLIVMTCKIAITKRPVRHDADHVIKSMPEIAMEDENTAPHVNVINVDIHTETSVASVVSASQSDSGTVSMWLAGHHATVTTSEGHTAMMQSNPASVPKASVIPKASAIRTSGGNLHMRPRWGSRK